jgi:hypothetical protein
MEELLEAVFSTQSVPRAKNRVGLWDHIAVRACFCVSPLSLLGNGSVKLPLSLLGSGLVKVPLSLLGNGYFFYAVRVLSKESRRLVFPRTSCLEYPTMNKIKNLVIPSVIYHRQNPLESIHWLVQWYSTFFIRIPPNIISLGLCTPKVVGV